MGTMYNIACESCGYAFGLMDGTGFFYDRLETMINRLSPPHKAAVEAFQKPTETKDWSAWMHVYECTSCNDLSSHLYFSIYNVDGDALIVDYRCSECSAKLKPVYGFDRSKHKCPRCGKRALGNHPLLCDGDWD